jgi:hypothetical protein
VYRRLLRTPPRIGSRVRSLVDGGMRNRWEGKGAMESEGVERVLVQAASETRPSSIKKQIKLQEQRQSVVLLLWI